MCASLLCVCNVTNGVCVLSLLCGCASLTVVCNASVVCTGQLGVLGPVNSKVPDQPEVSPHTHPRLHCPPPPYTASLAYTTPHTHVQAVPEAAMDSDEEGEDLQERLQALRS